MTNNDPDLKKELKKKEREFHALKDRSKRKLKSGKEKIHREKDEKLEESNKKMEGSLKTMSKKALDIFKKIEKRKTKLQRKFDKKEKDVLEDAQKENKDINKEAAKAEKELKEITQKEIEHSRKKLISIKRRVYSRRRKIINTLQFIGVIYLFMFSIIIMKDVAIAMSNGAIQTITSTVDSPASAFGAGWFSSIIAQSASVIAILTNTLVGADIIDFNTAFYILLGLTLGNAVTPILASLVIKTKHHWHLRHGFELGLANVVYSFFLIIIVFLIQVTTGLFTTAGDKVAKAAENLPAFSEIPDLLAVITDPVKNLLQFDKLPLIAIFVIGVFLLIFSLGRVGKSMFIFLGGKRHTRAIMEKHLRTHWRAFAIGLGLTIVIPSSSLLVTLMVPLAIARVVTLRQAIPYMIGTSVGTFIDVLLASFANAEGYAIAGGVVLTLMSAFGIIFLFGNFGSTLIYKITRYLSFHVIKMRKRNILKYIAGFVVIPAIIMLIF
ncbi:hypothetical protein ACFL3C_02505 [Patescibacteria group bacterium]